MHLYKVSQTLPSKIRLNFSDKKSVINLHKKTLDKNIDIQYISKYYICSHMYYRMEKTRNITYKTAEAKS